MSDYKEKFIIGLGNPGGKYDNNRHNVGFLLIQTFVENHRSNFVLKNKLKCNYAEFISDGVIYRMFTPTTYMNNSGESIRAIIDWFKVDKDKLIIVVDDIDIPLGKIRVRRKGSSGGHNGLKSIIKHLGTAEFKRLKIGIGPPSEIQKDRKSKTVSHVLGRFSNEEFIVLNLIIQEIISCIDSITSNNWEKITTRLNSYKPEKS